MKLRACADPVLAAVLMLAAGAAVGQSAPSLPASSPADRAARDADKVYRMILMHADKPRRASRDERSGAAPTPSPSPAGTATAPTAAAPAPAPANAAPAVTTMSAEAAARVALPVRTDVELPVAAVPAAAIAPPALPSMKAVPELASVRPPRPVAVLELVSSVEPEFPQRLLRTLGSGSVVVEFDVAADGTVSRAAVVRSPHRGLHAAALAAVSAWRFKPPGTTMPGVAELKFE